MRIISATAPKEGYHKRRVHDRRQRQCLVQNPVVSEHRCLGLERISRSHDDFGHNFKSLGPKKTWVMSNMLGECQLMFIRPQPFHLTTPISHFYEDHSLKTQQMAHPLSADLGWFTVQSSIMEEYWLRKAGKLFAMFVLIMSWHIF